MFYGGPVGFMLFVLNYYYPNVELNYSNILVNFVRANTIVSLNVGIVSLIVGTSPLPI